MTAANTTPAASQRGSDPGGLAGSALVDRAVFLLGDRAREKRAKSHRVWTTIAVVAGVLFLAGSLAAIKFDIAATQKAQQFAALVALFGALLLATGWLTGWHSAAVERQLFRLALLRSTLDSTEATAEWVRMQTRLSLALKQCHDLPEDSRGACALALLEALNDLEQRTESTLPVSDLPPDIVDRLMALGVSQEALRRSAEGAPTAPGTAAADGTPAASKAA
jgi:hypothetical protein